MGINLSNKQISAASIPCDGTFQVTLALAASPDITSHPTDIALVLDRSGSMSGAPLANMKAGPRRLSISSTRPPTAPRTATSAWAAGSVS